MKKSFLNSSSPFATVMVQEKTAERAILKIRNAVAKGATAIGVQLSSLKQEYKSDETLKSIFSAAGDKPVYVTNYRGATNEGKSDEILADELLHTLSLGATLVDIMGDAFDPSPEELTVNETAIKKQREFIDEVHRRGGEALMSSHVFKFRSAERVLEIAKAQARRGADVIKIVTGAETEEEQIKNLDICRMLKSELEKPFLFLSAGKSELLRTIGPAIGACMWLCFTEYDEATYFGPPLLENVLKIKSALQL